MVMVMTGADRFQTATQNQHGRQDLEQKLRSVASVIYNHAKKNSSPTFTKRLEDFSE